MSLDIGKMLASHEAQEAGREIELLDAEGAATGAFVTVTGPSSRALAGFTLAMQRRRLRAALQIAETTVKSWRGIEQAGAEFPCTPENIARLMADASLHSQVLAAAGAEQAFTKP